MSQRFPLTVALQACMPLPALPLISKPATSRGRADTGRARLTCCGLTGRCWQGMPSAGRRATKSTTEGTLRPAPPGAGARLEPPLAAGPRWSAGSAGQAGACCAPGCADARQGAFGAIARGAELSPGALGQGLGVHRTYWGTPYLQGHTVPTGAHRTYWGTPCLQGYPEPTGAHRTYRGTPYLQGYTES